MANRNLLTLAAAPANHWAQPLKQHSEKWNVVIVHPRMMEEILFHFTHDGSSRGSRSPLQAKANNCFFKATNQNI